VTFEITPGKPALLAKVESTGHPAVPVRVLSKTAAWQLGRRLTSDRLDRGLLRIHQFYLNHHYLQAITNVDKRDVDQARNAETLIVRVEAGPVVTVKVRGARVSLAKMKELLPMYSEGVVDQAAVDQGARNLEDHFQRLGYFSIQVSGKRAAGTATETNITYTVRLGPEGEFEGYSFAGNQAVRAADLAANLNIQARDFPFVWRGTFSRVLLEQDVSWLTAYYQARGFLDVRVTPRLDPQYRGDSNHLFVTFQIDEGPQTRVGQLKFLGLDEAMRASIEATLAVKPGRPYSPAVAQAGRDAILSYLADRGYSQAAVNWKASPPSADHTVDLEYDVRPGPTETIGRVILIGNEHTRAGLIRREIALHPGQPLDQSKVLESQRHLYDLGLFSQVQIAPQAPDNPETQKPLLVRVDEGQRWSLGYGFGLEGQRLGSASPQGQFKASPRASLDLTRIDVGGRDQTFSIRGRLSDLEKSAGMDYFIPRLPVRRDLSFRISGLFDQSRDVATFSAERSEAAVSIEKHYSATALLVGRFDFRHVLVDPSTLKISPNDIPLASRPARIGMLGASYINDRRDNPADATRGSYSLADAGVSSSDFGSQANFLRFSGQNSTYYSLGPHVVFARDTRIGIESPYGPLQKVVLSQSPPDIIYTHEIPLPEEFFMGGSETHRGFSINQAGPRDPLTGFPVGGNALFLNTLELRLRIRQDRLGFALFHDAGNVYSSGRLMKLLKVTQSSPTDLNYTSHALGTGLRYKTPVGPLRFDVGYNLNPPKYQVEIPGGLEVRQLSHFQFFVGVGQSF